MRNVLVHEYFVIDYEIIWNVVINKLPDLKNSIIKILDNLKKINIKLAEQRIVHCIKLEQDLPGLDRPPLPGDFGQKIYDNVSKQAFKMFLDHFKMIVNEYRLDLTSPATDKVFEEQMREFFFGGGIKLPDEYIPPAEKE